MNIQCAVPVMGSPFGSITADFFIGISGTNQLKETMVSLHVYHRFVDDIFCVNESNCDVGEVLQQCNAAYSYVQFIVEVERNRDSFPRCYWLEKRIGVFNFLHTERRLGSINNRTFTTSYQ